MAIITKSLLERDMAEYVWKAILKQAKVICTSGKTLKTGKTKFVLTYNTNSMDRRSCDWLISFIKYNEALKDIIYRTQEYNVRNERSIRFKVDDIERLYGYFRILGVEVD